LGTLTQGRNTAGSHREGSQRAASQECVKFLNRERRKYKVLVSQTRTRHVRDDKTRDDKRDVRDGVTKRGTTKRDVRDGASTKRGTAVTNKRK
jgi:hypothetical protein